MYPNDPNWYDWFRDNAADHRQFAERLADLTALVRFLMLVGVTALSPFIAWLLREFLK